MTTSITVSLVNFCSGQGHVTVDVTADDVGTKRFTFEAPRLREALDWSDAPRIVGDLLRMHFRGMTANQAKTELQAGISFTI